MELNYQLSYFGFFDGYYVLYKHLNKTQKAELIKMILEYAFEGKEPKTFSDEFMRDRWYNYLKPNLVKSIKKSQNKKGKTKSN